MGTFGRRLLLAVDAKGYGGADAVTQRQLQEAIRRLLSEAAAASGLEWERWETQVGGDSVFAVLPEGASEPDLVDTFMRHLDAGLRAFNHGRVRAAWLRLRAVVHFGSASPGAIGFVGRAPVEVGRMLDSAALKAALAAAPDACLALAVSPTVFNDVISDAYTTIRAQEFREVVVAEKEHTGRAWIRVPGYDARALDLGVPSGAGREGATGGGEVPDVRPPSAPTAPGDTVVQVINGTVHAPGSVFGISK
ncbi:hypothetical protein [Streptomyces aurantiogriseus]|uniref:Guanylate cyclase domain-containing protein n=1 Tax=Streptomyces aurantiogriseus TaxID=66870 RepID=A0A918C5L8_9ACTN|nr:hypothetical protein [Streptomyces aurantiogriseus]GGR07014.1 hypothetical protein GCM10010251_23550 [Streptomyces aurantiogriseus]